MNALALILATNDTTNTQNRNKSWTEEKSSNRPNSSLQEKYFFLIIIATVAKRKVLILKLLENVSDLCLYVWFIYSLIKNLNR